MSVPGQKKLKVRDGGPSGLIAVYQDGSASDADASSGRKYDDAFTSGALASGRTLAIEREWINLRTLTHSYDSGKSLAFDVHGLFAWKNDHTNTMTFNPNDTVEFFATLPTVDTGIATPSWHLNDATPASQVRLFYGFIETVTCDPDGGLSVTCRDPMHRANLVKLQRSAPDGITIPKIAFNLPRDNPDFFYSVKITDASSPTPWGTGESVEDDTRCTIREILEYLMNAYQTDLVSENVLESGVDLFTSADLGLLNYKPGPIVLENTGFTDGVREILRRWAPHVRIVVDHQTTQWRIVPYGPKLTETYATGTGTFGASSGSGYQSAAAVDLPGLFTAGDRVRIYGGGTLAVPSYSLTQELTIHSIVSSTLRFVEACNWAMNQYKVYKVDTDALPVLDLTIDDVPRGGCNITMNTDGVYTAVNLWSVYQETETMTHNWNRQDLGTGHLQPGWNTGFEAVWNDRDSDRETDLGSDGQGMRPYRIGNDGTRDYFEVSYTQSQYGTNHVAGEWDDVTCWIWTENGADIKNQKRTYTVYAMTLVADVGDGSAGIRITLDAAAGTILLDSPAFKPINDASATEDRIILTQNYRFPTTKGNNKRWEVGRKFYFTDTTISFDQDSTPHVATCSPRRITSDNGDEMPRRVIGMSANLGYPQINVGPSGAWETLATGGLGATHVWRRATYTRTPTGSPCSSGTGWKPPRLVSVEYERTTTTLRNARWPSDGYSGPAYARWGLASQLDIAVEHWAEEAQSPDYAALALRIWQATSHAHHQGTITKPGIVENGIWLDLGIDVNLRSSLTEQTYGASFGGFWGTLTECTLNFEDDVVEFGFDTHDRFRDINAEVYEEFGVRKKSTVPDMLAMLRKINELPKCLEGSQFGEQPGGLCGNRVFASDGKTVNKHITTIIKGQQESGAGFAGAGKLS